MDQRAAYWTPVMIIASLSLTSVRTAERQADWMDRLRSSRQRPLAAAFMRWSNADLPAGAGQVQSAMRTEAGAWAADRAANCGAGPKLASFSVTSAATAALQALRTEGVFSSRQV